MDGLVRSELTRRMTSRDDRTTLVVGATGKTGRRVAERPRKGGVPVRGASRTSEPPFDWETPSTWAPARNGASAAYVSYFPDLAAPGASEAIPSFAKTAVEGGTRRLVLLSVVAAAALAEGGHVGELYE